MGECLVIYLSRLVGGFLFFVTHTDTRFSSLEAILFLDATEEGKNVSDTHGDGDDTGVSVSPSSLTTPRVCEFSRF